MIFIMRSNYFGTFTESKWKPLNDRAALGQRQTDGINQLITISKLASK
jgi:hypothetical protein